jgi:hypothetical protein
MENGDTAARFLIPENLEKYKVYSNQKDPTDWDDLITRILLCLSRASLSPYTLG